MAIPGYDISVGACRGVLSTVQADSEAIGTARTKLSSAVDAAIGASRSQQIGDALIGLWNDVLVLQCEAATTRIENAVNGVSAAVNAYVEGDAAMADTARSQVTQMPSLAIDDAKE
ncbi:hypothetical protein RCH21_000058 [Arthrobacter sp. PL16]|uniref:DUF6507 family protein n=1 Tax=Arthrobacter sp. PL16 TaxID=3071720 RepID=UPI002DF99709|nr:hypothetical protein [Arthrobacter sp. PL16]